MESKLPLGGGLVYGSREGGRVKLEDEMARDCGAEEIRGGNGAGGWVGIERERRGEADLRLLTDSRLVKLHL